MKGFLVLSGIDFSKTHNLDELAGSVLAAFPSIASVVAPVDGWTNWGVAYRYPDEPEPPPEPSAAEVASALDHLVRLEAALEAQVQPPAAVLANITDQHRKS